MRLSRIITAVAVGLAVIGAPAAAGAAQPFPPPTVTPQPPAYPPTTPTLTADRLTMPVEDPVTITGTGWPANRRVRLDFDLNPEALRLPGPAPAPGGGTGAMAPVAERVPDRGRPIHPVTLWANSDGYFSYRATFHDPGTVVVTATSLTPSHQTASLTLTVTDRWQPTTRPTTRPTWHSGGGTMPITGSRIGPQIGVGVAAVLAGALLLWFAVFRRRRSGERSSRA